MGYERKCREFGYWERLFLTESGNLTPRLPFYDPQLRQYVGDGVRLARRPP
jgi:hypothetical protein